MNDLERRIRDSLHARADDVEPTPQLWREVQIRRSRRRRLVWAGAVSGVTAAVAAAIAVPVVTDRPPDGAPFIEPGREPEPPATGTVTDKPTGASPTPTRMPPPAEEHQTGASAAVSPLVTTDGSRIVLRDGATGEIRSELYRLPADGESTVVTLAVRPGSTLDDITAALLARSEGMYDLRWLRWRADGEDELHAFADAGRQYDIADRDVRTEVVPAPVWSPDGQHLAWLEQDGSGSVTLRTVGWGDEGPGTGRASDDNTAWAVGASDEYGPGARLQEWVWNETSGTEASGFLYSTDPAGGDEVSLVAYEVERQGDGALALIIFEGEPDGGRPVVDIADTEADDSVVRAPTYLLTVVGGTDGAVDLALAADDEELPVPRQLEKTSDVTGIWMTAVQDRVLVGNGVRAWLITRDRSDPLVLQGPAVSGDFLR